MTDSAVHVSVPVPYVAVVELDRPPVNALGRAVREELIAAFDALHDREDVRAIVLSARGAVFCAGADIKEKHTLGGSDGDHQRANRLTREAFNVVLDSAKPVI